LPAVAKQTGLSRASIYRLAKMGRFPLPVKVGTRASAWLGQEVDAFITSRIAARESK